MNHQKSSCDHMACEFIQTKGTPSLSPPLRLATSGRVPSRCACPGRNLSPWCSHFGRPTLHAAKTRAAEEPMCQACTAAHNQGPYSRTERRRASHAPAQRFIDLDSHDPRKAWPQSFLIQSQGYGGWA